MRRPEEARDLAEDSLRIAERAGAEDLMAGALQVLSYIATADDAVRAEELAEASWGHAVSSGDDAVMVESSSARYMAAGARGDLHRILELTRELSQWCYSRGLVLQPSADLSEAYLELGGLRAAEGVIRTGLTGTGAHFLEARMRVLAGLLASRQGRKLPLVSTWPVPARSCPRWRTGRLPSRGPS